MRLEEVKLMNFRGYRCMETIRIGSMLAIVGKNDVGKSTILEALDIFFNDGEGFVKMTAEDANKQAGQASPNDINVEIACVFSGFPENVILDDSKKTSLASEQLLRHDGRLEVVKVYPNGGRAKVYVRAFRAHDKTNLMTLKNHELKELAHKIEAQCSNCRTNVALRQAIKDKLNTASDEFEQLVPIRNTMYANIAKHFPKYELFQSDRKNADTDATVRDPISLVVKRVFEEATIRDNLFAIWNRIDDALKRELGDIREKVGAIDSGLLPSLLPKIPRVSELKWWDVLKGVSLEDENQVPLNKRGSGVKRLVLLGFFMAMAERRGNDSTDRDVIYAVEEPETAQHYDNQIKMIDALQKLSAREGVQVLFTTHSANMLRLIDWSQVCIVEKGNGKSRIRAFPERAVVSVFDKPKIAETAYLLLGEFAEEYHDELYGYIESKHCKGAETCGVFKGQLPSRKTWIKDESGELKSKHYTLSYYVRNSIHHPENTHNDRYTAEELKRSIEEMRNFIQCERQFERKEK